MTEYQRSQVTLKYHWIKGELAKHNNNKSKTAKALQVDRKTIYNIIRNYELLMKVA